MNDAALQISLTPVDLPHAQHVLPHQVQCWAPQVDRIILTVETRRSSGRYGQAWEERAAGFEQLLEAVASAEPKVAVSRIDYSASSVEKVAGRFNCRDRLPLKDLHGAPFYGYLYGLHSTGTRYVLHADADILFGGGSATWMEEAVSTLRRQSDVLFSGPLPGPPTPDGQPRWAVLEAAAGSQRYSSLGTVPQPNVLQFRHMSTRCFLVDVDRLAHLGVTPERTPPPRFSRIPAGVAPLEVCLSAVLRKHDLVRQDILGSSDGMWTLHPPYRTAQFIRDLPTIIHRVETGDVPDEQRGDYDLNDSMVDWSGPRHVQAKSRRRARLYRLARTAAERTGFGC